MNAETASTITSPSSSVPSDIEARVGNTNTNTNNNQNEEIVEENRTRDETGEDQVEEGEQLTAFEFLNEFIAGSSTRLTTLLQQQQQQQPEQMDENRIQNVK